jgi:hypothetical protein
LELLHPPHPNSANAYKKNSNICEISGFHDGEYEERLCLGLFRPVQSFSFMTGCRKIKYSGLNGWELAESQICYEINKTTAGDDVTF